MQQYLPPPHHFIRVEDGTHDRVCARHDRVCARQELYR